MGGKRRDGEAEADVHKFRLHSVPRFYCLCVNSCVSICLFSSLAGKMSLDVIRQRTEAFSFSLLYCSLSIRYCFFSFNILYSDFSTPLFVFTVFFTYFHLLITCRRIVDRWIKTSDRESFLMARRLIR